MRQKAAKFKQPVIGCLGLAFKADVDDLRESPALDIVRRLRDERLGDHPGLRAESPPPPRVRACRRWPAVEPADIVLLLVDHRAFGRLKPAKLQEKVLIDTRGMVQ